MGQTFSDNNHTVIQIVYYLIVNNPCALLFSVLYFEPLVVFFKK